VTAPAADVADTADVADNTDTADAADNADTVSRPRREAARTAAVLALLSLALPANLLVTVIALLRRTLAPHTPEVVSEQPRTILISGGKMTKALHLARCFHRAGHRVVLVEAAKYRYCGHRFSRCVDAFHATPSPGSAHYPQAIAEIVRRERVDLWVPVSSPASSVPEAEVAAQLGVPVLHGTPESVARLDDKAELAVMVAEAGLPTPDSHRITDPAAVAPLVAGSARRYILKSIPYDPVNRLDLTPLPRPTAQETETFARSKPISPEQPWVLQELLEGVEYCTHTTAVDGSVQLHVCCPSSAFQVNYQPVELPPVEAWVRRFVATHRLTGQISFDLIVSADGIVRAIECNPRTHSAITVFDDPTAVAQAYLERGVEAVTPRTGVRPTYWLYHELWRMLSAPSSVPSRLAVIFRGRDAIFDWEDPLPFLLVHHLQIPWLLIGNLRAGRPWLRIDFNIGKLVEPAGD